MQDAQAQGWLADRTLGADCARHSRLFFGSPDLGLETALPGTFTLLPVPAMREALSKDYEAMGGMIFGGVPDLDDVLAAIAEVERIVNAPAET